MKATLTIEIPENCVNCPFYANITNNCPLIKDFKQHCSNTGRDKDCPLQPAE